MAGAHSAIEQLLSEQPGALVQAVISKYVMLSSEELQEWREEPEVGGWWGRWLWEPGRLRQQLLHAHAG